MFYISILISLSFPNKFYTGYTSNLKSRLDEILLIFLLLNQVRFVSDKAQKNKLIDSHHAAYASTPNCVYSVGNDNNLLKKTKIAYKILNISTIPLTLDEFLNKVN